MAIDSDKVIWVSAVLVQRADGRVLQARKHGARYFLFPGGKPEVGETPLQAAVRELAEETGLAVAADELVSLGHRCARAANEAGFRLEADVFALREGSVDEAVLVGLRPHAEISELAWVAPEAVDADTGRARAEVLPAQPARGSLTGAQVSLMRQGCLVLPDVPARWVLRPASPADAAAVVEALAADPAQMSRQGPVSDLASARDYLRALTQDDGAFAWVAVDPAGMAWVVVGACVDSINRLAWAFYWAHPAVRGRGVTAAAVRAVADYLLDPAGMDLERLELGHRENNPASGVVARAAGFVQEGRERAKFLVDGRRVDVLTYGRLRSDVAGASREAPIRLAPLSRSVIAALAGRR